MAYLVIIPISVITAWFISEYKFHAPENQDENGNMVKSKFSLFIQSLIVMLIIGIASIGQSNILIELLQ